MYKRILHDINLCVLFLLQTAKTSYITVTSLFKRGFVTTSITYKIVAIPAVCHENYFVVPCIKF